MIEGRHFSPVQNVNQHELLAVPAILQIPERGRACQPMRINADVEHGCDCIRGQESLCMGIIGIFL
jgi:hypothetical protein